MEERVSARLTSAEGRRFGYTVGIAFVVFAAIAMWRDHVVSWKVLVTLGGALLVAGTVMPTRLGPVQRTWMAGARLLSRVTTPIVMGLVYFAVITPIAVLTRAIGRDPMKHLPEGDSYWVAAPSGGRSDMERQF